MTPGNVPKMRTRLRPAAVVKVYSWGVGAKLQLRLWLAESRQARAALRRKHAQRSGRAAQVSPKAKPKPSRKAGRPA